MDVRKITTFISSSMLGQSWLVLRENIKKELESTNIIDAFIIEDISTTLPSIVTYRVEIETRDIMVFIFEDKLRPAVKDEFDIAYKNKKKMLMFFKECEREPQLQEFNDMVIKMNSCTYKKFKDSSDLKSQIQSSLVNDILRIYRYYCLGRINLYDTLSLEEESPVTTLNQRDINIYSVDKRYLAMFEECKNYLLESLGLQNWGKDKRKITTKANAFGIKLIDWITGKTNFPCDDLSDIEEELYDRDSEPWVRERINAIKCYFIKNDMSKTMIHLNKAKYIAEQHNAPSWLINDILVDVRNIEFALMNDEGRYYESVAQKEIDASKKEVIFPYIDRLHSNFYDKSFDEFFKIKTASVYSQQLGGNLNAVINDLESIAFVSLAYGSLTQLMLIQLYVAKVLYLYEGIYQSDDLAYTSLKMFILSGNNKFPRKLFETSWDKININIQNDPIALLNLTDNISNKHQKSIMRSLIFEYLGMYFNDADFEKIQEQIFEYALNEEFNLNRVNSSFKALQKNMDRVDSQRAVDLVENYLDKNWVSVIEDLYLVLYRVNWVDVKLKSAVNVVQKITPLLFYKPVGYGIERKLVMSLRHQLEDITHHWDDLVEEKWDEFNKEIYRFETKTVDYLHVKKALINNFKTLNERNDQMGVNGSYPLWGNDLLQVITSISNNYISNEVLQLIEHNLFSAILKILKNHHQSYSAKTKCFRTLMEFKSLFDKEKYSFDWNALAVIIEKESNLILNSFEFGFGEIGSKTTLEINMLAFLSMCGKASMSDSVLRFIDLSNEGSVEEIELVKSLSIYLNNTEILDEFVLAAIITILFQKSLNSVFEVRWYVAEALWKLVNTKFKSSIHAKIYSLSEDSNYILRHKVISLAEKMYQDDKINSELILRKGANDSNYIVRMKALESLKSLGL